MSVASANVRAMAVAYKVVIDCADPHRLAAFWATALDYLVEDHSALVKQLLEAGQVAEAETTTVDGRLDFRDAAAVRDPDAPVDERSGVGLGGRVLFQVVPEPKTVKNRVHLDLHIGAERRAEVVDRLTAAGGRPLWEGQQGPNTWVTMADPEGNEFCVA
jgi:Glyoxalase-like domain